MRRKVSFIFNHFYLPHVITISSVFHSFVRMWTSCNIFCKIILLIWNLSAFVFMKMSISLLLLKGVFLGTVLCVNRFIYSITLKWSNCLLACILYDEKSAVILIFVPLLALYLLSLMLSRFYLRHWFWEILLCAFL